MRHLLVSCALLTAVGCAATTTTSSSLPSGGQLLTIDHYVRVQSTAPSMNGQTAQLYVRERVEGRTIQRGSSGVVLFVHGAGTPAEVAFDVPTGDYSWMAYLARAGFDVFSMDMTGYGRSTRPTVMNDPCNLSREQQATLRSNSSRRAMPAQLSASVDHHRVRLERPRRGRRVHQGLAPSGSGEPGGVVAGRAQSRRLRGATSGQSAAVGVPGSRLQPHGSRQRAGAACRRRGDEYTIAPGAHCAVEPASGLPQPVPIQACSTACGRRCSSRIRSGRHGALACDAPHKRRRGAGTPRWWGRCRLRR